MMMTNDTSTMCVACARSWIEIDRENVAGIASMREARSARVGCRQRTIPAAQTVARYCDCSGQREHGEQHEVDGDRPGRACELRKELEAEERRVVRRVVQVDHQECARARLK